MARATPQEGTPAIQGNLHVPEDCRAVSGGPGADGDKWMVPVSTPGGRRPFKTHVANLMRGARRISVEYRSQLRRDAYIAGRAIQNRLHEVEIAPGQSAQGCTMMRPIRLGASSSSLCASPTLDSGSVA